MKRLVFAVVPIAVLCSGIALAQLPPGGQKPPPPLEQPGKQTGVQLPEDPQQFVQHLYAGNQKEVRLGKLGEVKGQSQQVRDFGQMLAQDHDQANKQVKQLAEQKKWPLTAPKPQDARQRAMKAYDEALEAKLRQLEGTAFDQAYIAAMVAEHDEDLAKLTLAQQQYQGSELAQLAGKLLPKIAQHRDHAYRLLGELGAKQPGVGGSGR